MKLPGLSVFVLMLSVYGVTVASADITGPFYWDDCVEYIKEDTQNGGALFSNPNPGGSDIPWQVTNSHATTHEVSWDFGGSIPYIEAKFGTSESGETTFSYSLSNEVPAPPEDAPCGACNHHQVFLAYVSVTTKLYENIKYYLDNEGGAGQYVVLDKVLKRAEVSGNYTASELATFKYSEENYGDDNYPRPNPYIYYTHQLYNKPDGGTKEEDIGLLMINELVERDWT